MFIELINYTPNPEKHIAESARICYGTDSGDDQALIRHLVRAGHTSALEHATFTFRISGVSRACMDQITRHRLASHSVRSQRYCNEGEFNAVIPPAIAADVSARRIYGMVLAVIRSGYRTLIKKGFAAEDARYLLPMGCETAAVQTFNAAALLHFFARRCCNRAQWEIRDVAGEMLSQVRGVAPTLFERTGAPCEFGACREIEPCGKKGVG